MSEDAINPEDELIKNFVEESNEFLNEAEELFVQLEKRPSDIKLIQNIFRPIHTIKGSSSFFGLEKITKLSHQLENLLDGMRKQKIKANQKMIDVLLQGVDLLKEMIGRIERGQPELEDDERLNQILTNIHNAQNTQAFQQAASRKKWRTMIIEMQRFSVDYVLETEHGSALLDKVTQMILELSPFDPKRYPQDFLELEAADNEVLEEQDQAESKPSATETASEKSEIPNKEKEEVKESSSEENSGNKTMRIPEKSIDTFLARAGELVEVEDMFTYMENRISTHVSDPSVISEFKSVNEMFGRVSRNLQKSIMEIRKLPIRTIFQKVPRIVRNICSQQGKNINVIIEGEETLVDKSLLESLDGPLTHMVRNAADHGVEMPNVRKENHKSEQATIVIKAFEKGSDIFLQIMDDGGGINYDALRKKALSLGLIEEDDVLSQDQLTEYMFASGVSTKEEVTDVSGRGVGMDVVKRKIEEAGGKIIVHSQPGEGTEFTIQLPTSVSTQIISALIFRVGEDHFAATQLDIQELVRISEKNNHIVETIPGGRILRLREKIYPLISLGRVLNIPCGSYGAEDNYVVLMVRLEEKIYGLVVDEVLNAQDIVVKPISNLYKDTQVYNGTTILGDGRILMVIDPKGIAQKGQVLLNEITNSGIDNDVEDIHNHQKTGLLLFRSGSQTPQAILLSLLSRLDEFNRDEIEYTDGGIFVQYHGKLLRLIDLGNNLQSSDDKKVSVLVFSDNIRIIGLVIDELLDIVFEELQVKPSHIPGILGTTVIRDKATEIIDVYQIIKGIFPDWLQAKDHQERRKHILVVDRSSFFTSIIKPLLKKEGFNVTTAYDAEQATNFLKQGNRFSLIMTDIHSPEVGGLELAENLKSAKEWQSLPIIALKDKLDSQQDPTEHPHFDKQLTKFDSAAILETAQQMAR